MLCSLKNIMKWKTKDLQELVPKLREKGYYKPKQQRPIDWSSYTLNQINDLIDTINFIKNEVDMVHTRTRHTKVGKPPIDPGNLAKSIFFCPKRKDSIEYIIVVELGNVWHQCYGRDD